MLREDPWIHGVSAQYAFQNGQKPPLFEFPQTFDNICIYAKTVGRSASIFGAPMFKKTALNPDPTWQQLCMHESTRGPDDDVSAASQRIQKIRAQQYHIDPTNSLEGMHKMMEIGAMFKGDEYVIMFTEMKTKAVTDEDKRKAQELINHGMFTQICMLSLIQFSEFHQ